MRNDIKDVNDLYLLARIVEDMEDIILDLDELRASTKNERIKSLAIKATKTIEKIDLDKPRRAVRINVLI
jgi:predicted RNA-binding protein associated with RNAse of E/G family